MKNWISIKDKLPNDGESVLYKVKNIIFNHYYTVHIGKFNSKNFDKFNILSDGCHNEDCSDYNNRVDDNLITHWISINDIFNLLNE